MNKNYINWNQFEADTLELAEQLKQLIKPSTELVAVSRGGLFTAGIISYALNLKDVHCVSLESYSENKDGANHQVVSRTSFLPDVIINKQKYREKMLLVVDDINDTSNTYRYIKDQFEANNLNLIFATTYHKDRDNNLFPDCYGRKLPAEQWVVFPWDKD